MVVVVVIPQIFPKVAQSSQNGILRVAQKHPLPFKTPPPEEPYAVKSRIASWFLDLQQRETQRDRRVGGPRGVDAGAGDASLIHS